MGMKKLLQQMIPSYRVSQQLMEQFELLKRDNEKLTAQIGALNQKTEYCFWLLSQTESETPAEVKKRVFLSMPKATGKTREIQLAEAYILKKVKKVCEENAIPLFLTDGTLLGAQRHHGFIPWDDDVDTGVMRQDLDRLFDALSDDDELTIKNYYIHESGKQRIKVKFRFAELFFIDVWVLDRFEADESNVEQRWNQTQAVAAEIQKKMKEMLGQGDGSWLSIERPDLDEPIRKMQSELMATMPWYGAKDGQYICYGVESDPKARMDLAFVRAEKWFPIRERAMKFEGELFSCANQYEALLYKQYGDYWTLPDVVSVPHEFNFEKNYDAEIALLREKGIVPLLE